MDRQKKYSKEKVTVRKCILNSVTTFKLLGINFCVKLEKCGKLNFPEKVRDIKETINKWNRRYLTPLDKIMSGDYFSLCGGECCLPLITGGVKIIPKL